MLLTIPSPLESDDDSWLFANVIIVSRFEDGLALLVLSVFLSSYFRSLGVGEMVGWDEHIARVASTASLASGNALEGYTMLEGG